MTDADKTPAAAQGEALTDEQIDDAIRKEMGPWLEDQDDLVLYRQVAKAVLRAAALAQGEAPPPSVPVGFVSFEKFPDASGRMHERRVGVISWDAEVKDGDALYLAPAAPPPEQAQPAVAQPVAPEVREFLEDVSKQKPEKPDYWSSCGQCERNTGRAEELLESLAAQPAVPALTEWVQKDEAENLLWEAIHKRDFGNPTDDKLILEALREKGVGLARFTTPPAQVEQP
jgi:hypothetical protein